MVKRRKNQYHHKKSSDDYGKLLVIFVIIVFGTIYMGSLLEILRNADFFDFRPVYVAAEIVKDGNNPYDSKTRVEKAQELGIPNYKHMPVLAYPPFYIISLIPFTYLGFSKTRILWILLNHVVLIAIILGYIMLMKNKNSRNFVLAMSLIMLSLSEPLARTLKLGQVTLLVLGFVAMGLYLLRINRDVLAGMSIGVAMMLKLQPGLLVLFLMYKRMNKAVFSAGITFCILLFLSVSILGWDIHKEWLSSNKGLYTKDLIAPYNKTLQSYIGSKIEGNFGKNVTKAVQVFVIIAILMLCRNDAKSRSIHFSLEYSFVLISIMAFSPLYWDHHYVYFLLPFMVIFDYFSDGSGVFTVIIASVAFVFTSLGSHYFWIILGRDSIIVNWLQVYGGAMLWIVYAYVLYRMKRHK